MAWAPSLIAHILQINWIYKDVIDLNGKSVLDKLFFKMKYKEYFISWFWSQTLSIILRGFKALQTSELFKNQQNWIC